MTTLVQSIAETLKSRLGSDALSTLLDGCTIELANDHVNVTVASKFAAHIIAQNMTQAISEVFCEVVGKAPASISVVERGHAAYVEVVPIERIPRAVAPDDAQRDFFIPGLSELALKDDVHLMEMTPFTLRGRGEKRRELIYTTPQGITIRVQSTGDCSLPTIDDYDLVLMMQTWLADLANQYRSRVERYELEKKAGRSPITLTSPPRMFDVNMSEVVKFKRRKWGGAINDGVLGSFDRLWSTEVAVDFIKGTKYRRGMFRLVGSAYEKLSETENGKASRVRVAVPDWIYAGIVERAVPMLRTFNRDDMILTQPLHRALYRFLSLKVPKDSKPFTVSLVELAQRFQTKQQQKYFNRDVKKAIASCPEGRLLGLATTSCVIR